MSAPSRKVSLVVSEQAENSDRKSFDDESWNNIPPSASPDRRGSVPLFGSLIYYRSQSLDPTILSKSKTDDDTNEMQSRGSANRSKRSFSYSHDEQSQVDNISEQLKEFRLSSEGPHVNNGQHPDTKSALEHQISTELDNETSDSNISVYEPTTPTYSLSNQKNEGAIEDPFNIIDAKVESQRRQSFHWFDDTVEKNKCRNRKRNKNKDRNVISAPDSEVVKHNENSNSKTDLSGKLDDKSNSCDDSHNLNKEDPDKLDTQFGIKSLPRQGRHRRRLTCAMIFTKPKFVDV